MLLSAFFLTLCEELLLFTLYLLTYAHVVSKIYYNILAKLAKANDAKLKGLSNACQLQPFFVMKKVAFFIF